MIIFTEQKLRYFKFWCGAKDTASELTFAELDQIESILEDAYPEGVYETLINDLFWFEPDLIAEWLGYENWETLLKKHKTPF